MAGTIFYNPHNKEFRLGADAIQPEVRYSDGRIKTPAESIKFNQGIYRPPTSKHEQVVKECQEFKDGRVRIVTEEELQQIMAATAQSMGAPMGMVKVSQGDELGYKAPEDTHKVITK